jgi:hypothetical protein
MSRRERPERLWDSLTSEDLPPCIWCESSESPAKFLLRKKLSSGTQR